MGTVLDWAGNNRAACLQGGVIPHVVAEISLVVGCTMAMRSASLLLELSQILSEKAQELTSSAGGSSSGDRSLGISDPIV